MADFLYKGTRVLNMIERGGPVAPPANDRYLVGGGNIGNWFNTFHNSTANNINLQFNIGDYLAGSSFFPTNTCAVRRFFGDSPGHQGFPATTATAANPTWYNTTIYTSPTLVNGSITVVGDTANVTNGYGSPNYMYCILVGGGAGGGGGGRTRGASSGTAGQGGGGGGGEIDGVLIQINPNVSTMNYTIGGGGRGVKSGQYYSENPGPLNNNPVNGQRGGDGRPTAINYAGVGYAATGGFGGFGGRGGGSNGARGNAGPGGGTSNQPSAEDFANFATAGNAGTAGNAVNVSVLAPGGTRNPFLRQSNAGGAYSINSVIGNYGAGGFGGTSDRDTVAPGNGRPAGDGTSGCLIVFFFYD